jgi:hypothetical protein
MKRQERETTMLFAEAHEEARIRARLDDWAKAARAKDIDAIMAVHAPEVLVFDWRPFESTWKPVFPACRARWSSRSTT